MSDLVPGPDGAPRCGWCGDVAAFFPYHDREWGFPVADDTHLFEKLVLESFQSGLSWRTILDKRDGFRRAFAGFDIDHVAAYGPDDVTRLLADAAIVRHRGKIEATIANARCAQEARAEQGSLAAFLWSHAPEPGADGPTAAAAMARALKRRGWRHLGPTTLYAFMQAAGLVNDHAPGCAIHAQAQAARLAFIVPR